MLRNPDITQFRVVTIPAKAVRDAGFFLDALQQRKFAAGMICVNRTWAEPAPESAPAGLPAELLDWYRSVSASHAAAVGKLKEKYGHDVKEIRVLRELDRDVEGVDSLSLLAQQFAN